MNTEKKEPKFSFSYTCTEWWMTAAYITHHFQLRERACYRDRLYVFYQKPCHAMQLFHMQISCWHYDSFHLLVLPPLPHDWYAFMPFEYKIRDSRSRFTLHTKILYVLLCASYKMRNLACATRFIFMVRSFDRSICECQHQSESTMWEVTNVRLKSELKFKWKIHDSKCWLPLWRWFWLLSIRMEICSFSFFHCFFVLFIQFSFFNFF